MKNNKISLIISGEHMKTNSKNWIPFGIKKWTITKLMEKNQKDRWEKSMKERSTKQDKTLKNNYQPKLKNHQSY